LPQATRMAKEPTGRVRARNPHLDSLDRTRTNTHQPIVIADITSRTLPRPNVFAPSISPTDRADADSTSIGRAVLISAKNARRWRRGSTLTVARPQRTSLSANRGRRRGVDTGMHLACTTLRRGRIRGTGMDMPTRQTSGATIRCRSRSVSARTSSLRSTGLGMRDLSIAARRTRRTASRLIVMARARSLVIRLSHRRHRASIVNTHADAQPSPQQQLELQSRNRLSMYPNLTCSLYDGHEGNDPFDTQGLGALEDPPFPVAQPYKRRSRSAHMQHAAASGHLLQALLISTRPSLTSFILPLARIQ